MTAADRDRRRAVAAEAAVAEVRDGMVVGLGTGSTAALAVAALGRRVANGLRVLGVPTSERVEATARSLGIPLAGPGASITHVDVTIDGADEVERGSLHLLKGGGGALLREKIVAAASARMLVVVDEAKLTSRLGTQWAVPVEIPRFGVHLVTARLIEMGLRPTLRSTGEGTPLLTDNGNHVVDLATGPIEDSQMLEDRLRSVPGVLCTGLFLGLAARAFIGTGAGVVVLDR
jgi:ribose 5-phosphate isomerase A